MIRQLEQTDRRLYLTLLANFALMGGVVTLFGAALAKVIQTYGWSYTDAGTVYAASSVGFFVASFTTGFLIDRFGSKPVLIIGLAAEAISLMFFARTPSVPLNVALYFIVGLGLGSNEAITNVTVVRIEERGKSRLMNLIHAFWCVGAVLGPLGVADLIRAHLRWQLMFPLFGILIVVMTLLLALQHFPKPGAVSRRTRRDSPTETPPLRADSEPKEDGPESNRAAVRAADRPVRAGTRSFVLLCAAAIFVYIGVEKGVYSWAGEFFVRVLGAADSVGAAMVALYWAGQFTGRITISFAYRGSRLELVLLSLASLTLAALLVLVFVRVTWIAIACTLIAGLANSGIFPLIISLTGKYSTSGKSVGIVTAAGGMAGFLFPILVATISDFAGIARGFESVFVVSVVLLFVVLVVVTRVRRLDGEELPSDDVEVRIA